MKPLNGSLFNQQGGTRAGFKEPGKDQKGRRPVTETWEVFWVRSVEGAKEGTLPPTEWTEEDGQQ